jgi:hypothetical protein
LFTFFYTKWVLSVTIFTIETNAVQALGNARTIFPRITTTNNSKPVGAADSLGKDTKNRLFR